MTQYTSINELYSLPIIYNKGGIIIFKKDNKIIKCFDEVSDINILNNKKAKLEILLQKKLINFSNCLELNFSNTNAPYYSTEYIKGNQVCNIKGYKYCIEEKIKILYKIYIAMCEAHENKILINDIHGRNFIYNKGTDTVKGIDIDNFKIENYCADELPDFIYNFVDDIKSLDNNTDTIAFGLMILDILCPKNVDIYNLSKLKLFEFINMLNIQNYIKEEMYCIFNSTSSNIENILSGISNQQGMVI